MTSADTPSSWRTKLSWFIEEKNPIPYSIRFWFSHHDIFHPIRIARKIKNIFRWIPTLWNDHDWDSSYLLIMLKFKLENMRTYQEQSRLVEDWQVIVSQIQEVEDCLDRILKDDYAADLWKEYAEKFPRSARFNHKMTEEERPFFWGAIQAEEAQRKSDLEKFTSIMRDHALEWWD